MLKQLAEWGATLWFNGSSKSLVSDQDLGICKLRRFSDWWEIILYQHGNLADLSKPKGRNFNEACRYNHSFHMLSQSTDRCEGYRVNCTILRVEFAVTNIKCLDFSCEHFFPPSYDLKLYSSLFTTDLLKKISISFQSLLRYVNWRRFGNRRTVSL